MFPPQWSEKALKEVCAVLGLEGFHRKKTMVLTGRYKDREGD